MEKQREKFSISCQSCAALVQFELDRGQFATVNCPRCHILIYSRTPQGTVQQKVSDPIPLDDVGVKTSDYYRDRARTLLSW